MTVQSVLGRIGKLPVRNAEALRGLRRELSAELRAEDRKKILELACGLTEHGSSARLLAYELVKYHGATCERMTAAEVRRLGRGIADWGAVDAFACYIAGPAWRAGRLSNEVIQKWARSHYRWWKRAALVSTVPLNVRAQGGAGDAARTLAVCEALVDDRDDMVVKAMSWALRALAVRDEDAVRKFIVRFEARLAPRVKREVGNKLRTGLKKPDPAPISRPIIIRGARQLLTLQGPPGPRRGAHMQQLTVIPDGAVLIVDGTISQVGTSRRVEALAESRNAVEINAAGRVVMPGFVDCHTHLAAAPLHTVRFGPRAESDSAFSDLIRTTSRFTLEAQAQRALDDFVRHGTTTVESKSGHGLDRKAEMKILRAQATLKARSSMVVSTFTAAPWLPLTPSGEFLDFVCAEILPVIKRRRLAEFADIVCERDAFTPDQARRYYAAAKKLGFQTKMHTGRDSDTDGVIAALQAGAASIDHLNYLSYQDSSTLGIANAIATLLPCPTFYAGGQNYAPARRLIDSGAPVALASGYDVRTSATQNMQTVIALACSEMGMTVEEAISAATINGAHAVRRADQVGSIEWPKRADILLLGVPDYREIAYHFGVNLVDTTIKNGRVVFHRAKVQWPAA